MATDRNEHLHKVLKTHEINKLENLDKFIAKKNQVKNALNEKFSEDKASNCMDSGSYAKHTAINTKFDIDCCIPFRKREKDSDKGYSSLSDMFEDVYKYLKNEYTEEDDDIEKDDVRKQKVSIGLKFNIDGEEFEMDVVPGRERPSNNDYGNNNTDLSLHIHPPNRSKKEVDDGKTRIKTNIKKHLDLLSGSSRVHERKVAKLLKVWKTERKNQNGGKLIKSFMMELYTKEAFDQADEIPNGLWGKVKMVMNHIVDNITENDLVDPANSSNIVSDSMSDTAKSDTKSGMKKTIKDTDEDSDKIKEYFPINEEYDDEDDDSNSKASSVSVLSTSKFG
ncbi:nucleotidyltransferase [Muricauda oceani]|uniref:Nucleotidyltransferase n=1 Tax=Flagellimonas oceani TaxID=2698672 RepID=A0A6G7IZU1_9FLAO|nr:nucleotidyltransferase [Allomuricauda oceani]MBW8244229.1 nucleotidyltransferase [Allomuricauda oceani]QII44121.1 nucleotidyltransferase [Allomuricauda oceani]